MFGDEKKREYVRVHDEFNVRLVKRDTGMKGGNLEINTSKSINISANGLLINTVEKLETDSEVGITFMKPNTFDFFKGTGKVVRVEQDQDKTYKIAIAFVGLSPDDKKMLDYYIKLGKEITE